MSKLKKSAETIRKEENIAALKVAVKKKRSTVKGLRTRLKNTKQAVVDMQRETMSKVSPLYERMQKLQQEVATLLKKLLNSDILETEEQKEQVEDMLEEFSDGFPGEAGQFEEELEAAREAFASRERVGEHDPFAEFSEAPGKEEKRDIRKLYLRLSHAFHPDRATTKAESKQYHDIMQRIVEAYERHDVETLLSLERQHLGDIFEEEKEAGTVDVLDAAIERLERELAFLEKQADRLSAEIKSLRQSDIGQALTDFDRGKREGYGIDFQTELTTDMMDQLEEAKEIFADALRRKEMTPELAAQLEPLDPMDVLDMVFGDMLEEEEDYDFFGPPPKFREGQLVEFRPAKHSAWLEDGLKTGIKGVIVGYVDYPGDAGHVYELLFGPEVMQAVSAEVVTDWVEEYMLLPYIRIEEPELRPARGRRPDIEGGLAVGRKRLYAEALKDLDPEKRRRIEKIVLADPGASDEENWMAYFIEHPVRKPVPVRILPNPFPHLQNPTGQLMGIGGYDEEDGVLAIVENGGSIMPAPLLLLVPGEEGPESRFLEDYQDWAERRLLVDFGLY